MPPLIQTPINPCHVHIAGVRYYASMNFTIEEIWCNSRKSTCACQTVGAKVVSSSPDVAENYIWSDIFSKKKYKND